MPTAATHTEPGHTTEATLCMACALREKTWKLGFATGPGHKPRARGMVARNQARVLQEIAQATQRCGLPEEAPVVRGYAAGRDGCWLHRFFQAHGITNHVVDSSAMEVSRRQRRATSDGVTATPNEQWMMQVARNVTMEEWGILKPDQYLIHDGDKKFCPAYNDMLDNAGVKRLPLPPRSPNLNAIAERWVQSVKSEALSRFILFGEKSLRHVLTEYLAHYHAERPHQGKGNVILVPGPRPEGTADGPIACRERLGGMLKYYERQAA